MAAKVLKINLYRHYVGLLLGHIVGKSGKNLILLTKFTFITDIMSTHAFYKAISNSMKIKMAAKSYYHN